MVLCLERLRLQSLQFNRILWFIQLEQIYSTKWQEVDKALLWQNNFYKKMHNVNKKKATITCKIYIIEFIQLDII